MPNYVFAYKGGTAPTTEQEGQAMMEAWGQFFGTLGSAIVDNGNRFGPSRTVTAGGSAGDAGSGLSGYSVVKSDSLDAAVAMAQGCPVLASGGSVDVYETVAM